MSPSHELSGKERAILKENARRRARIDGAKFGTPSAKTLERTRRRKAKPKL